MGFFSWLMDDSHENLITAEHQLQSHKEALAKAKANLRHAKMRKDFSGANAYYGQVCNHQHEIARLKEEIKRLKSKKRR